MPEKPEVARTVFDLRPLLTQELVQVQIQKWPEQAPQTFTIMEVKDWGKYILFIIAHQNQQSLLVQHLRMSGKWLIVNDPQQSIMGRLYIVNKQQMLYFYDTRKFGTWDYYPQYQFGLHQLSLKIGYDWLVVAECYRQGSPELQQYLTEFKTINTSNKNICAWLMDHKPFTGIGNYLKAEILYAECLAPTIKCNQLTVWQVEQLFTTICRTILAAYYAKGVSVRDYLNIDGQGGKFVRFVYNQEREPCFQQEVTCTKNASRTTHWCPTLQKENINQIDPRVYNAIQALCIQRYNVSLNLS